MEIHRSLDPDKTLNYIVGHLFVGICVDMGLLYLAIPILGIMSYTYEKTNQMTLLGKLSITKKRENVGIGGHPLPLSWEPLFMKKL